MDGLVIIADRGKVMVAANPQPSTLNFKRSRHITWEEVQAIEAELDERRRATVIQPRRSMLRRFYDFMLSTLRWNF